MAATAGTVLIPPLPRLVNSANVTRCSALPYLPPCHCTTPSSSTLLKHISVSHGGFREYDQVLFGGRRFNPTKHSQLLEIPRMLLAILNCCILPKGSDNIYIKELERFVLGRLLMKKRISLPWVLLYQMVFRRVLDAADLFPHNTLIMKILIHKGFPMNGLFDEAPHSFFTPAMYEQMDQNLVEKKEALENRVVEVPLEASPDRRKMTRASKYLGAHRRIKKVFAAYNLKRLHARVGRLAKKLKETQKELLKQKVEKKGASATETMSADSH